MKNPLLLAGACALVMLSSGCVVGHRSFSLEVPAGPEGPAPTSKGTVAITDITDARHFENHPGDPSTPSVDGDFTKLSAEQLSTYIGRQRNTYGHAMGDVGLPPGQSVKTKVAELVTEGLRRRGYSVGPGGQDGSLSIRIDDFWSWMTPGFVALSFEARMECTITITRNGKETTVNVKGYALNHGQIAKDKNWQEAFDEAFENFLKDLDAKLASAGF
jgi:hypothetical protein